jgi:hypothetical protein
VADSYQSIDKNNIKHKNNIKTQKQKNIFFNYLKLYLLYIYELFNRYE